MLFGIVGNGFVGKATQLLKSDQNQCLVYDSDPKKCLPVGTSLADMAVCKIIFICVPTPCTDSGDCNTSIVESCIHSLRDFIDPTETFIVCRSTVMIGTCERLGIYHMPEFLTEKNWKQDFLTCRDWIFGIPSIGNKVRFSKVIEELLAGSNLERHQIHYVDSNVSETIKYVRNTFLATKVAFFNEMFELCKNLNIDYEEVRKGAIADPRIGDSHSSVPGLDGKRGFGGHCLPKDLSALRSFMLGNDMNPYVLDAVYKRNNYLDRA